MKEMGNRFWDTNGDLLVLDKSVVADAAVIDSVSKIKKTPRRPTEEVLQEMSGGLHKHSQRNIPKKQAVSLQSTSSETKITFTTSVVVHKT